VNVAISRPAFQSSTRGNDTASNAVDTGEGYSMTIARTLKETDPWWRVDLGKSVWVESVFISGEDGLFDVDIRIGNTSNHWFIMSCMDYTCTTDLQERWGIRYRKQKWEG